MTGPQAQHNKSEKSGVGTYTSFRLSDKFLARLQVQGGCHLVLGLEPLVFFLLFRRRSPDLFRSCLTYKAEGGSAESFDRPCDQREPTVTLGAPPLALVRHVIYRAATKRQFLMLDAKRDAFHRRTARDVPKTTALVNH